MQLRRRGFALVELLVALVVTALLGGALFRLIDRSQRLARGIALMADQRAQLAVAALAIDAAVQGITPGDGDILATSDSSMAYHGAVGGGVACALGGTSIDLPPATIASGATLSWWNTTPQAGDSVAVLDDGLAVGASDDRWVHAELRGIATRVNACVFTPFLDSLLDAGRAGWRLTLSQPLPASVATGAVVRVLRPERVALYRSAGEWMAGWTERSPATGGWNVIQPLAGPLLPYAPPGLTGGMTLQWQDSLGAALAPGVRAAARSLSLGLGAITRQSVRVDGLTRGLRRDSLSIRIPLRNAP